MRRKTNFQLSHLIIPGVDLPKNDGLFKKSKIGEILKNYTNYDIKIMGICLGMHILFENSEEFINKKGLNIIKGNVKK